MPITPSATNISQLKLFDLRNDNRYVSGVIKSFKMKEAENLLNGRRVRKLPSDIQKRAMNKLLLLNAAATIDFLRAPPSNHLEALTGDRAGQYSIRINNQWRICFIWMKGDAYDVEIVDYH